LFKLYNTNSGDDYTLIELFFLPNRLKI